MPVEPPVASPRTPAGGVRAARRAPHRPVAGGTDLLVQITGELGDPPERVLDIWHLDELRGIRMESNALVLGALTTYAEIRRSPLIAEFLPAFAEAAATIGAAQIQNRGTIGGNVMNASPAGDMLPLLLACDAQLIAGTADGERWIPVREFWPGYRRTALEPTELLLRISIPLPAGRQLRYRKVGTRRAQAISKVVMALCLAGRCRRHVARRAAGARLGGPHSGPRCPPPRPCWRAPHRTEATADRAASTLAGELEPDRRRALQRRLPAGRGGARPASADPGRGRLVTVDLPAGVRLTEPPSAHGDDVLTPDALAFLAHLHRSFDQRRTDLLRARTERQAAFDAGALPDFLPETAHIRDDPTWRVASAPADLDDRRVEITGPVEPKMMINALNSGARVFMADFEDALSPTWENVLTGQWAVAEAVRRRLTFQTDEKTYALNPEIATLVIRPRGWHLEESHLEVDGSPISASLFDFGLAFFHNAREQLDRASGPYFYLPKLESHLEARLWNDVFVEAQAQLGIPRGSIRATVLIETILAAFEMDEILWELREHASGLNAGRWDYIFSLIKKFHTRADMILPDRAQVTMAVPFMRAYQQLLVRTCHARGAHAIGGMSAFIPNRREPEVTENALARVREDKQREAGDGSDGTWVAHPDLVPVAAEIFDAVLGDRPNQKDRLRPTCGRYRRATCSARASTAAQVTEAGVRTNVSVALQYLASWLAGNGAAAINNLMEDAATAEISRSQLWQWRVHGVSLDDGEPMTAELYAAIRDAGARTRSQASAPNYRWTDAANLLDDLVLSDTFAEFLTLGAYARL